jgi:hypothetical protein
MQRKRDILARAEGLILILLNAYPVHEKSERMFNLPAVPPCFDYSKSVATKAKDYADAPSR